MSGTYIIESQESRQFIPTHGYPGGDVILAKSPAIVDLSPALKPPSEGVATIKGQNGLYINIKPSGPPMRGDLVWSEEPYEWTFDNDKRISTVRDGEVLHWFNFTGEDTIILNPYSSSSFNVTRLR